MPARSSWKGFLRLSLVSVPVKAYTATTSGGGGIHLNQLHETCHSRIRYKKVCPIHGEVPNDEIVSGYEFAKDQYVVVDPDELRKLRPNSDKAVDIDTFVPRDDIGPEYFSGKSYYLVPDGPIAQKPYRLIRESLQQESLVAVGEVVISNREQLVAVRPVGRLLSMAMLQYKSQVKEPAAFEDDVVEGEVSDQELALTKQLMEGMQRDEWDLGEYRDGYTERLSELIQARVEGEELVTPPEVEEPQVINLMDALKASLEQIPVPASQETPAQPAKAANKPKTAKPRRKAAENVTSRAKRAKPSRKKKSG
jgi:DNA end-binding protein Ku